MVRSLNANVIIPLVLAFAIGVLVYLYGTTKSQFHSAEHDLKEIRKDLADTRSEKESLRYELDTLTDELEQLSKDKKEALQRAEAAEQNAHKANDDMDKLQASLDAVNDELHKAHENADELQGSKVKVKADLTAYISKWKQCEAAKKDLNSRIQQKDHESEVTIQGLRDEMEALRSGKIDAERKLNEMEQNYRVCESSAHQQQGQQQAPAVDDRSLELLPPGGGAPADGALVDNGELQQKQLSNLNSEQRQGQQK